MRNESIGAGLFVLAIIAVISVGVFAIAYYDTVPAGHVGVTDTFGEVGKEILNPGFHGTGVFTSTIPVNIQVRKAEYVASAASKDLQTVTTGIAINYRVQASSAATIYQELGLNFQDTIIQPVVQEAVKSITAQYTAEELITKRSLVKEGISARLVEKVQSQGLIVTEVSITEFKFSDQFNTAIESKVRAEQDALRAVRDLDRIRTEAEQKVTQARAEADSLRVQRQEITSDLLELRRIENQAKFIERWDGILPTVIAGDSGLLFNMNAAGTLS